MRIIRWRWSPSGSGAMAVVKPLTVGAGVQRRQSPPLTGQQLQERSQARATLEAMDHAPRALWLNNQLYTYRPTISLGDEAPPSAAAAASVSGGSGAYDVPPWALLGQQVNRPGPELIADALADEFERTSIVGKWKRILAGGPAALPKTAQQREEEAQRPILAEEDAVWDGCELEGPIMCGSCLNPFCAIGHAHPLELQVEPKLGLGPDASTFVSRCEPLRTSFETHGARLPQSLLVQAAWLSVGAVLPPGPRALELWDSCVPQRIVAEMTPWPSVDPLLCPTVFIRPRPSPSSRRYRPSADRALIHRIHRIRRIHRTHLCEMATVAAVEDRRCLARSILLVRAWSREPSRRIDGDALSANYKPLSLSRCWSNRNTSSNMICNCTCSKVTEFVIDVFA